MTDPKSYPLSTNFDIFDLSTLNPFSYFAEFSVKLPSGSDAGCPINLNVAGLVF